MGMSTQALDTQIEQHIADHKRQSKRGNDQFYLNTYDLEQFKSKHARRAISGKRSSRPETPVTLNRMHSQHLYTFHPSVAKYGFYEHGGRREGANPAATSD